MKKYYPLIFSQLIFWVIVIWILGISSTKTGGEFTYALDDTYIHMSIAKNLAEKGNFSVDNSEFTSSSSSLLWSLLLSISIKITGDNELIPFYLNLMISSIIIAVFYWQARKYITSNIAQLLTLTLMIMATPLPALVFVGMEHLLQTLFGILYIVALFNYLNKGNTVDFWLMCLYSLFISSSRFECLFLVFATMVILLIRKDIFRSVLLGTISIIPIVGYGLFSVSKGWFFFPNSIMLKGSFPDEFLDFLGILFYNPIENLLKAPHLGVILVLILIFLYIDKNYKKASPETLLSYIYIISVLLHVQFAKVGWLYRYEAYQVSIGIIVCVFLYHDRYSDFLKKVKQSSGVIHKLAYFLLFLILLFPLAYRSLTSINNIPKAIENIHDQQIQMSRFIDEYYDGSSIVLNDIGAVNYYCNIHTCDINGLSNMDIAIEEINSRSNPDEKTIMKIVEESDSKIALIHDSWFEFFNNPDYRWIKVGKWYLTNNYVCGSDSVGFYANTEEQCKRLKKKLDIFSKKLPKNVEYTRFD